MAISLDDLLIRSQSFLTGGNLLGVLEDGEGGGTGWSVMDNGVKEGLIELGLVKTAHQEDDRLADGLKPALVTEQISQQIHEPVGWEELSKAKMVGNPLQLKIT